jgi:uncharacterized membrane protein
MLKTTKPNIKTASTFPNHIENTVQAIAKLHIAHAKRATRIERIVERVVHLIGRPKFVGYITLAIAGWIFSNLGIGWLGLQAWDPPPFNWLQGTVTLIALYITSLILITQQRDDQLAAHREQITLQIAIMSEQKSAKIIQLLEEMRRDDDGLCNRVDTEAAEMSLPADPQAMLNAIHDTQGDMLVLDEGGSSEENPNPIKE